MKIEFTNVPRREIEFKDLDIGDVFFMNNQYHIKTNDTNDWNALMCSEKGATWFVEKVRKDAKVVWVKATLTIDD